VVYLTEADTDISTSCSKCAAV